MADEIERIIAAGELGDDGFIDTENGLTRRFKLSRVTVRKASEVLIAKGIIQRRPGKGLFVAQAKEHGRKKVWVLVDNLAWEPCVRLARGVKSWAKQYDFDIELQDGHAQAEQNLVLLNEMVDRDDIDGALIMAWHTPECFEALCRIKDRGLPFVVIDYHNTQLSFPNVVADNYHGGWLIGEHLYELGHRNFAFLGDCQAITVQRRLDGYRDYLAEKGIAMAHSHVGNIKPPDRFIDWSEWIDSCLEKIFDCGAKPTALFCSCDNVARAVYHWCAKKGVRIPDDLSVAGFDNDPASQWLIPELTTVSQPFSDMGDTAMALLRDLLSGKPWDGKDRILPVQFIPRKSTQSVETVQPASR